MLDNKELLAPPAGCASYSFIREASDGTHATFARAHSFGSSGSCGRRSRRTNGFCAKHELEKRGSQRRRDYQRRAGVQGLWLYRQQYLTFLELDRSAERDQELSHHGL